MTLGCGYYSVRAFQFQRKRSHVISEFSDRIRYRTGPFSDGSVRINHVQPPLNADLHPRVLLRRIRPTRRKEVRGRGCRR